MLIEIGRYFVFSGFEYFAVLYFIFSLFRLKPLKYIKEILVTVLFLNVMTIINIFFVKNPIYFSTFLIVLAILSVSLFCIFGRFTEIVLGLSGFGLYIGLQYVILNILLLFDDYNPVNLTELASEGEILQILTSITVILVSLIIQFENSGFSFAFEKWWEKLVSLFLAGLSPLMFFNLIAYYYLFMSDSLILFFLIAGVLVIILNLLNNNYHEKKQYKY